MLTRQQRRPSTSAWAVHVSLHRTPPLPGYRVTRESIVCLWRSQRLEVLHLRHKRDFGCLHISLHVCLEARPLPLALHTSSSLRTRSRNTQRACVCASLPVGESLGISVSRGLQAGLSNGSGAVVPTPLNQRQPARPTVRDRHIPPPDPLTCCVTTSTFVSSVASFARLNLVSLTSVPASSFSQLYLDHIFCPSSILHAEQHTPLHETRFV